MSQKINVPTPITAAQLTAIDTNSAAIELILDGANVPLTPSETKTMISVSTVRSGEIGDVNTIVVGPFPVTVPNTIVTADFEANILYIAALKKRQAILNTQAIKLQTLINIAENNSIVDVNLIMKNARMLAGGNKDILEAVGKITAKYFVRAAPKKAIIFLIIAAGIMTISGLKKGKKFTNSGATILTILIVGGSITLAIKVNPFTSIDLPSGWTNIVVTNLSPTEAGAFEVFVK